MNTSYYLNYNTCISILHAVDFAKNYGKPLNTFITINFSVEHSQNDYQKIFRLINRAKNRWIKAYYIKIGAAHVPPLGVHVFENPKNHPHVHWLLYIPTELVATFQKKVEKWLLRYQGFLDQKAIKIEFADPYTDKNIANYMIKGVDPIYAPLLGAQDRQKYQGPIKGQRARASRALGKTNRKRAGFVASLHRHHWLEKYPEIANLHLRPDNFTISEIVPQIRGTRKLPTYDEHLASLFGKKRMIDITQQV